MRGYFGIGIYHPKTETNIGSLFRTAHSFDADMFFTIGRRYRRQASDTTDAARHIPLVEFTDIEQAIRCLPFSCMLIGVELDGAARPIHSFSHPERAIYLLGAEDHGLPPSVRDHCHCLVQIPGRFCLNVAVAGSIILYDRIVKGNPCDYPIKSSRRSGHCKP